VFLVWIRMVNDSMIKVSMEMGSSILVKDAY